MTSSYSFILLLFLYVCYVSDDDGTYHHKKSKKLDYIRHISLWPKSIRIFHILGPLATSHLSINIVRKLLAIIRWWMIDSTYSLLWWVGHLNIVHWRTQSLHNLDRVRFFLAVTLAACRFSLHGYSLWIAKKLIVYVFIQIGIYLAIKRWQPQE